MTTDPTLRFGSYRFDPHRGQLWRGSHAVKITPKAVAVLRYLIERPGQVVSKDELFHTVWAETVVGEAALRSCIQELRHALRDDSKKPRHIETVHRRGFRFIGKVSYQQSAGSYQQEAVETRTLTLNTRHSTLPMVGREAELEQLQSQLEKALRGERQIIFVTGEAGIGKTSVVEAFLHSLESRVPRLASKRQDPVSSVQTLDPRRQTLDASLWIGRGQCIEHYGVGEAYLPVLEALGRLGREAEGHSIVTVLRQQAPTWLVQLPALLSGADRPQLQREVIGATKERMLRELAEAFEALTVERMLILVVEDLQWSDVSTLDLLSVLARRHEYARLLVLGTYRPVEVLVRDHPLREVKRELQLHGQCAELVLDFLPEAAIGEYVAARFGMELQQAATLQSLVRFIHQRTEGNPLYMVTVVNDLIGQGMLTEMDGQWQLTGTFEEIAVGVPESLHQLIEHQLERVRPEEREILEAASVAGAEFSAAAVAAGIEREVEAVEEGCHALVRREQFLQPRGTVEWPDGTVAARYSFIHALYQDVLSERVPLSRRTRLHQQIGERAEAGYGERAREIAAELAVHFEQGRDIQRAVQYRQQAGQTALRRSAYTEATAHLSKGLALLHTLPDTAERAQQEVALQTTLGKVFVASKGFGAPEVEQAYARARELCQQQGENPQFFQALWGLWVFYLDRAELQTARELIAQLFPMAERLNTPASLVAAHGVSGITLLWCGEIATALRHFEQVATLYDSQRDPLQGAQGFVDQAMTYYSCYGTMVLWLLGYPDQAVQRNQAALTFAKTQSYPFGLAWAYTALTVLHLWRREEKASQEMLDRLLALANEHVFPYFLAEGTILQGAVRTRQGQAREGIGLIQEGLDAREATGTRVVWTMMLGFLAEAYGVAGQAEEGLRVLAEALAIVDTRGEYFYEAELYRLKGQLVLQSKVSGSKSKVQKEAEQCFHKAIDIARRQSAKSLELRAVMSLIRLWQRQGKKAEARKILAKIYGWFTEGFETADLQDAKALLKELDK